jgi:tRNA (guanosine-2'-O-)-methyltransferase
MIFFTILNNLFFVYRKSDILKPELIENHLTEERYNKIKDVVNRRQKNLTIVLENIHDPHNVSAILRSADAVGIDKVYLIYNTNTFPKIGRQSSASAKKWVNLIKFNNVRECFDELHALNYKIYSTHLMNNTKNLSLYDLNLSENTALVFGNEHEGVSNEVKNFSDCNFKIPMFGMIKSLNVSVSVAVCLYEALRQRQRKGLYNSSMYSESELEEKFQNYLKR